MSRLILASASPQRSALLRQIGVVHDSIPANIEETRAKKEKPSAFVARLAREKAEAIFEQYPDCYVLGADTIINLGTKILGKPKNVQEAEGYLKQLSGRRHRVWSGVHLIAPATPCGHRSDTPRKHHASMRVCISRLAFKRLTMEEIEDYIASQEWQNCAGGYAIQGKAGMFVRFLSGSYSNVVGLPLFETAQMLKGQGFSFKS